MEKLCIPPPLPCGAPWLVYLHQKKMQTFTTIWPANTKKTYLKEIPEFQGKLVRASAFGWLLLQDELRIHDFCLWNPVTLDSISLPPLEKLLHIDVKITTCALTSNIDDDFTVFVFCDHILFFCRAMSSERVPRWRVHNIEIEGRQPCVRGATTCNGVVYAWATIGHGIEQATQSLIQVKGNTDGNSIRLTSLELTRPHLNDPKQIGLSDYMLESCGHVYYVCFSITGDPRIVINAVDIWELDLDKKMWVEVKCLNNRAFFLGCWTCTWCWTNTSTDSRVDGNSVYIPWNFDSTDDNILYKYSLQDRSFTVYSPCPDLLSRLRQVFWFIPPGFHSRSLAPTPSQNASVDIHILNQNVDIIEYSEENKTTGNMLKSLPLDMISLISKYLYCFDYLDFRASCKTFRSLLPSGWCQWKKTYNSSFPFFVSLLNKDGLLKVMDSFRNKSCYITIPMSPKGCSSIEYCKDGCLILYSGGQSFQFFNLFTRAWGHLPAHESIIPEFLSIGFSTFLGFSNCVIVGMIAFPFLSITYMRWGDKYWSSFELEEEEEENNFEPSTCPPVYHNGGFYFLDTKGGVGVFELVGEEPTWWVYGRPKTRDTEFHLYHLVECDGTLFSVFIGKLGKWIQVFRFDDNKKVWARVKSLGNHVFFLSRSSSISTVAEEAGMGNRIYLPRLHDKGFIFYSLETRKYHVFGTEVSLDCFWPTEEPLECCWA